MKIEVTDAMDWTGVQFIIDDIAETTVAIKHGRAYAAMLTYKETNTFYMLECVINQDNAIEFSELVSECDGTYETLHSHNFDVPVHNLSSEMFGMYTEQQSNILQIEAKLGQLLQISDERPAVQIALNALKLTFLPKE